MNMWEDIFCGKQTPAVFMDPDSQFGLKTGRWWWRGTYSRPENCSEFKGNEFLLWMNYTTLARLKQLFSPALYIYWHTWKAAVINQVGFHIQRCTAWLLRFWASIAPCEVLSTVVRCKAANVKSKKTAARRITAKNSCEYASRENCKEQYKFTHILVLLWNIFTIFHFMSQLPSAAASSRPFCVHPGQHFTVTYLVDEWRLCRASFIMCPQ